MKKHNGVISLWKFLFCMMIVIYHANIFATGNENIFLATGSIGVEFFFLVSGYLMAKTALNKKDTKNQNLGIETLDFIWRKIKAFFPYVFICFVAGLIVKSIFGTMEFGDYILGIFDLLFIRMAGFKETVVNGVVWYISAMLISMLIIYPLIRKYKYNFIYIVAPVIVLLGGGWLNHTYGSLRVPDLWIGFCYKGLFRAFIELCLGSIIYSVSEKIKEINFTKIGTFLITIIEISLFTLPFITSQFIERATRYDYVVLFLLAIAIAFAFSEKTYFSNKLNNKFIYHLEKLSLPVYLSHTFLRTIINKSSLTVDLSYNYKLLIFVVLVIIVSELMLLIVEFGKKKSFYIPTIKKLIINS